MNTTERNEVIRECIMTIGEVVMSDDDWGKGYGEGYNDARGVLEALLSPTDQGVAPRELQRGHASPITQGCICPPGAEKTCQGPMCPRRPMISATGRQP